MKIQHVNAKNFLSFGETGITTDLSQFNLIVGPNASGKTNFLRTIKYAGSILRRNQWGPDIEYYHADGSRQRFEIEIALELNEDEIGAIVNYMILSPLTESVQTNTKEDQPTNQRLAFEIASKLEKGLHEFFRNVSLIIRGYGKESESPELFLKFTAFGGDLYIDTSHHIRRSIDRKTSLGTQQFARLLIDIARSLDPEIDEYIRSGKVWKGGSILSEQNSKLDKVFELIIKHLDERKLDAITLHYIDISGLERTYETLPYLSNLRIFLRDIGYTENAVDIFRILGAIYNTSILHVSESRSRPDQYAPLLTAPEKITDELMEFDGRMLSSVLFHLKNSSDERARDRYFKIRKKFEDLVDTSFDVVLRTRLIDSSKPETRDIPIIVSLPQYSYDSKEIPSIKLGSHTHIHEATIVVKDGEAWIPLSFSAAGIFELLLVLTAVIGQTHKILLLDEPALNLHPTKQIDIRNITEDSASTYHNQIILVTHSPMMISMDHAKDTWRFFRENGETCALQVSKELEYSKQIRKHLGGTATDIQWGEILFANGLVLVEGPSDKFVVEQFDKHLKEKGANLQDDNWPVIDTGGKSSLPLLMDIGNKLRINWVALTDDDGIMECNTNALIDKTSVYVPGLFAPLIENGVMSLEDMARLQTFYETKTKYKKEKCPEIQEIARKYRIFALPGKLEDVLETKVNRRAGKFRGTLESVEDILQRDDIPPVFTDFLSFVKEIKNQPRRLSKPNIS